MAINKQDMVRWDIFEEHFTLYINNNVMQLFEDEVKKESERILKFKANLGAKIMDNNYGLVDNPETMNLNSLNPTIFQSQAIFTDSLK